MIVYLLPNEILKFENIKGQITEVNLSANCLLKWIAVQQLLR